MNEFEKRINALRLRFKEERIQIVKDCTRTVGHLNNAIGIVNSEEARDALRAEKLRVRTAKDRAMESNLRCYHEQLELLNEGYLLSLKQQPSKRQLRRTVASLCKMAEAQGESSLTVSFGDNRQATIAFG